MAGPSASQGRRHRGGAARGDRRRAGDDIDIELDGFNAPLVPVEVATISTASQLELDSKTGRFTAALTVTGEGMNPIDTRIGGRVEEMVEAPVAVTRLLPETVLRADDVRMARVRTAVAQTDIATAVDEIVGMQLRRPVAAGQPLRQADLVRPPLVQRGSTVQIELSHRPDFRFRARRLPWMRALMARKSESRIRPRTLSCSRRLSGPGQVRVTPDAPAALPTVPARFDRRIDQR